MTTNNGNEYIAPGLYRHYKGKDYEVIGVCRHTETREVLVIYRALYKTDYGETSLWVRPFEMFCELVEINGEAIPRFQFVHS